MRSDFSPSLRDANFRAHFDGKRFRNPGAAQAGGFFDAMRWKLGGSPRPSPRPARFMADVTPSKPPAAVNGRDLRVTLVNHSTVLLQQRGLNILTDPIWSERASPVSFAGPRRRREPGVRWDDLPAIDIVLLSHNHYDHLDLSTLRRLAERGRAQFVVPIGVGSLLRRKGIGPFEELDWGGRLEVAGAAIHAVPAMHFSARGLFDRNRTLWCGYTIETEGHLVYFAGDTGFGGHFAEIRQRFGAPGLALLPIGAYEPRWFMSPIHMTPEEAVRAHEILAAKTSIAIHHGTFQLADEGLDEPKRALLASAPGASFLAPANGESVTIAP
jgi:L-ascorbate metabolism protein UlaG (beta-lactamase superfamily)